MRNIQIIERAISTLAEEGVITETERIYTKNAWRRKGYRVNNEETPIVTLPIFVCTPSKVNRGDKQAKHGRMLCVRANFYKMSQVTKIKKGGNLGDEQIYS